VSVRKIQRFCKWRRLCVEKLTDARVPLFDTRAQCRTDESNAPPNLLLVDDFAEDI
jgi:hypothetical protein